MYSVHNFFAINSEPDELVSMQFIIIRKYYLLLSTVVTCVEIKNLLGVGLSMEETRLLVKLMKFYLFNNIYITDRKKAL